MQNESIRLPEPGYMTKLAKTCGCSRMTVYNALRRNLKGDVADRVRNVYRIKYVLPHVKHEEKGGAS
jgi:hypothetical protein